MSDRRIDEAEVVVVGGGPSGSVAAAKLAELGHDVLLVDQSGFPRDKPCGDGLTHASVAFLERHGMGDAVDESFEIEDVRGVIGHDHTTRGVYRPWPQPPQYARVMQRRGMDNGLFDIAMAHGARFRQARVDRPLLVDGISEGIVLTGPEESEIHARCVIAADGATSRMRRVTGMGREPKGSHIFAFRLYATTENELEPYFDFHMPLLYEGGLLAGYGWVFPVAPRRANIGVAYYEPPLGRPRARIRQVLDDFIRVLTKKDVTGIGALSDLSDPIGAPIATQFIPEACQLENLIFTGEAARAADPLNGEGISFALHSGEFAAQEARKLLRTGRKPDQGTRIARRFTRLGSDLTLPARLTAAAPTGLSLVDDKHQPFMHRVRRVMGYGLDDNAIGQTDVHACLREADLDCAQDLDRVNERALDALRTSMPFALETTHRELRAEGGPIAAAAAIAAARGRGEAATDAAVAAATACELLALLNSTYPEVMPRAATEISRLNNVLALLTGQLVLTRALENGAEATAQDDASAEVGVEIAAACRRATEGLAAELDDAPGDIPAAPVEPHLATRGHGLNRIVSVAAHSGARLAGMNGGSSGVADAGLHIGAAWQIGNEIRDATIGDEFAGRPPGAAIRAGRKTLPLLYALETDEGLVSELDGPADGETVRKVLASIRGSGALQMAAATCAIESAKALERIDSAELENPEPLRALARQSVDRLPVSV
jgi:geranylgeranyl reductase family protein